jgi:hypothetical protein
VAQVLRRRRRFAPTAAVNLNWVFGPGENTMQTWMAPGLYLALQMAFWPLVIYLPSHWVFSRLFCGTGPRDWRLGRVTAKENSNE